MSWPKSSCCYQV